MKRVVTEGTGRIAGIKGLDVRGKTGTAQNPLGKDHAWFVAYAGVPGRKPEIAVAVLVQHGAHGASSAAPIARRVIKAALRHIRMKDLLRGKQGIKDEGRGT